MQENKDPDTVGSFAYEWSVFDHEHTDREELDAVFARYFARFPWHELPADAAGFDLGCGSGRWARLAAPRVGHLHLIDPGDAIHVARRVLAEDRNVTFHQRGVDEMPFAAASMDFGYSLGVLHHVPDTRAGIKACADCLKPGAPFLLYLYYSLDNKPAWYRTLWRISDGLRRVISSMPLTARRWTSEAIALLVYLPLARSAALLERCGVDVGHFPLSAYRQRDFVFMRNDAYDRFATPLEQRFSRTEITNMMEDSGLTQIEFNEHEPFWCAVGRKRADA